MESGRARERITYRGWFYPSSSGPIAASRGCGVPYEWTADSDGPSAIAEYYGDEIVSREAIRENPCATILAAPPPHWSPRHLSLTLRAFNKGVRR